MAKRRVSSITWRQVAASEIELRYDNGDVESVAGTHAEGARLAQRHGLVVVGSPLGTVRWATPPAGQESPPPASAPASAPPPASAPAEGRRVRHGGGSETAGDPPRPKRIGPWLSRGPATDDG